MKAIISFKSFPDHRGIPGHQGGSLPENDISIPQQLIDGIGPDEAIKMTIPISAITMSKQKGTRTLIDIQDNRKAYSKGRIQLYYDTKHKQFLVADGNHRLLESVIAGKKTINASVYSGYSDLRPVYDGEEKFDFNSLRKGKN